MNNRGGWMDGYNPEPEQRFPAPAPAPASGRFPDAAARSATWAKGQTSIMRPVICCPECGSTAVTKYDNAASKETVRWQCTVCANGFKLPRGEFVKCYANP